MRYNGSRTGRCSVVVALALVGCGEGEYSVETYLPTPEITASETVWEQDTDDPDAGLIEVESCETSEHETFAHRAELPEGESCARALEERATSSTLSLGEGDQLAGTNKEA